MELIMPVGKELSLDAITEPDLPNACYCWADYDAYFNARGVDDGCFHCGCACDLERAQDRDFKATWTVRQSPEEV